MERPRAPRPSLTGDDPGVAGPLPRGRHGLSHAFVVTNQRERLLSAIAVACTAKSYPVTTIKDITDVAHVSRRTFYDLFADKEACFLEAYDTFVENTFVAVTDAYTAGGDEWPPRIGAALLRLLELCAEDPPLAHLAVVDVHGAGRVALARRDATLRRFSRFLDPGRGELPTTLARHRRLTDAVVGGLYEALYNRIKAGEAARLPELASDLHYCAMVPFMGHARAFAESRQSAGDRPDC
jgi:AcrR family transcriptional regulator